MEPETWHAPPGDVIPNHPSFAVLLYRDTGLVDPGAARSRFSANGWGGSWVDGVFDYHHDGFTVVGAYPAGQEDSDLLRSADDAARARIASVAVPEADPVGGDGLGLWRCAPVPRT